MVATSTPCPAASREAVLAACHARLVGRSLAAFPVARRSLAASGPFARPLAELLTEDGDGRVRIDPASGGNAYGCTATPWPARTIELCSSTAAAISDHAFRWTERLREALARAEPRRGRDDAIAEALAQAVRNEIGAALELPPGAVDIVLAASGTDTELLAVMLALAGGAEPLLSLLAAPEESGRGVELAAGGRLFDDTTSLGVAATKGAPVWPAEACRLAVAGVPIRDATGRPRVAAEIDRDYAAAAERHLRDGGRVLLHALQGSKTGLRAPGAAVLRRLAGAHPGRVDVVVDACQWRCPPETIRAALRQGWMVQLTGSKFVGGPPFCGALLVPARLRSRAAAVAARPVPTTPITRPGDWPAAWRRAVRPTAAGSPGIGMLLRWAAAAFELALLRSVPERERATVLHAFAAAGRARLAASPCLAPVPAGTADPSILAFTVRRRDGRPAGLESTQQLLRALAARDIRIGQPVALRPDRAGSPVALRLVAGARLLGRVHYDPAGGSLEARIARELAQLRTAIDALEWLVGARAHEMVA
jgi:hypothetical protein